MTIPPMSWQPIETAPKDGTHIQVGGRKADKGGHLLDGQEHFARPTTKESPHA